MARQAQAVPSAFDRFLDWFDRHKYGVIGTLMLHTFLMFTLAISRVQNAPDEANRLETEMEVLPEMTDKEFELFEQQLASTDGPRELSDVKTMVSNITAERMRSTYPSRAAQERMADALEQDLKAFEQAEFDRLAQERRDRGEEVVVPQLDTSKWNKEHYMKKEVVPMNFTGAAMVDHDFKPKRTLDSKIPGYRCRGGGKVTIAVVVDRSGNVLQAKVDGAGTTTSDECMIEYARESAFASRFSSSAVAPDPEKGHIYYVFVAQ